MKWSHVMMAAVAVFALAAPASASAQQAGQQVNCVHNKYSKDVEVRILDSAAPTPRAMLVAAGQKGCMPMAQAPLRVELRVQGNLAGEPAKVYDNMPAFRIIGIWKSGERLAFTGIKDIISFCVDDECY